MFYNTKPKKDFKGEMVIVWLLSKLDWNYLFYKIMLQCLIKWYYDIIKNGSIGTHTKVNPPLGTEQFFFVLNSLFSHNHIV